MGIEPTAAGVSRQPDGFEGRAGHQTRIASTGAPIIAAGMTAVIGHGASTGYAPVSAARRPNEHVDCAARQLEEGPHTFRVQIERL